MSEWMMASAAHQGDAIRLNYWFLQLTSGPPLTTKSRKTHHTEEERWYFCRFCSGSNVVPWLARKRATFHIAMLPAMRLHWSKLRCIGRLASSYSRFPIFRLLVCRLSRVSCKRAWLSSSYPRIERWTCRDLEISVDESQWDLPDCQRVP